MKKYIILVLFLAVVLVGNVSAQSGTGILLTIDQQISLIRGQIAELTKQLNQLLVQKNQNGFCYQFDKNLTTGSSGDDVRNLVRLLKPEISAEYTQFNDNVLAWVKEFQTQYGIPVTGYVGPMTRTKLNELYKCANKLFITPAALGPAKVGGEYDQTLTPHSFSYYPSWSISKGQLPPGLTLTTLMGNNPSCRASQICDTGMYRIGAIISGKPTTPGTFSFTVQASMGSQTVAQDYVLTVTGNDLIAVTSPNGGEEWRTYEVKPITWDYLNVKRTDKVDIYLEENRSGWCGAPTQGACLPVMPMVQVLDKNISARSTYDWIVGTDIDNQVIQPGTRYKIVICKAGVDRGRGEQDCDSSDNYFKITAPTQ